MESIDSLRPFYQDELRQFIEILDHGHREKKAIMDGWGVESKQDSWAEPT